MRVRLRPASIASIVLLAFVVSACGTSGPPAASPAAPTVTAEAANATAIASLDSVVPATVVSTKLASAQALGEPDMSPSAPIWVVTLAGSFTSGCAAPSPPPDPCQSLEPTARALVDATTGAFMEGAVPAIGLPEGGS